MASTCPDGTPHYWEIDTVAIGGVYCARCKKCGTKRTYPACTESALEKVVTLKISGIVGTNPRPVKKSKRRGPGRPPKWA